MHASCRQVMHRTDLYATGVRGCLARLALAICTIAGRVERQWGRCRGGSGVAAGGQRARGEPADSKGAERLRSTCGRRSIVLISGSEMTSFRGSFMRMSPIALETASAVGPATCTHACDVCSGTRSTSTSRSWSRQHASAHLTGHVFQPTAQPGEIKDRKSHPVRAPEDNLTAPGFDRSPFIGPVRLVVFGNTHIATLTSRHLLST